MKIYIGTSGWSYSHWANTFYPSGLPKRKWLQYISSIFNTVEINVTFYREPTQTTLEHWVTHTPDTFLFSIKANRFITHVKRLREPQLPLKRFYTSLAPITIKIGAILFQFPPSLAYNPILIEKFLECLDLTYRTVIEIRHPSFLNEDFFRALRDREVALCWSDTAGRYPNAEIITADFLYIRLHGSPRLYYSAYSEESLRTLADNLRSIQKDAFVYFDNDAEGHAPANALTLKKLMDENTNESESIKPSYA